MLVISVLFVVVLEKKRWRLIRVRLLFELWEAAAAPIRLLARFALVIRILSNTVDRMMRHACKGRKSSRKNSFCSSKLYWLFPVSLAILKEQCAQVDNITWSWDGTRIINTNIRWPARCRWTTRRSQPLQQLQPARAAAAAMATPSWVAASRSSRVQQLLQPTTPSIRRPRLVRVM